MAPGKCSWIQISAVTKAWKIPLWYIVSLCASGWLLQAVCDFCFTSSSFPGSDRCDTGTMTPLADCALDRSVQDCSLWPRVFLLFIIFLLSFCLGRRKGDNSNSLLQFSVWVLLITDESGGLWYFWMQKSRAWLEAAQPSMLAKISFPKPPWGRGFSVGPFKTRRC